MSRVLIVGLDCVPPALAFERYQGRMPHLRRLMGAGLYGPLRSTFPPITLPAWASMVSGKDPGELGVYGFRTREAGRYAMRLQDARVVGFPRVWDLMARAGLHASALFVPPSYPPGDGAGEQVGCFLTPDADAPHTYPPPLKGELAARFGRYIPDVAHVGRAPDGALLEQLEQMTRQHFDMARYVWSTREPDFLMFVCIGPDRLHHAFYRHIDPDHPQHVQDAALGDVGGRFYALLDHLLGELLREVDDDTTVMVVSDHGARPLEGAFRINNWLSEQGWLRWRSQPGPRDPAVPSIDWAHTRAWAEGGYYARVCLNVRGREAQGVVAPEDVATVRARLAEDLRGVCGPQGERWRNRVEAPEDLYGSVRGQAPDLLAVFDDLRIRPLATVGDGSLYAPCDDRGDDRGNDACNHDWDGIVVLSGAGVPARGPIEGAQIHDVGATALALAGVEAPAGFRGRDLRELS